MGMVCLGIEEESVCLILLRGADQPAQEEGCGENSKKIACSQYSTDT